MTATECGAWSRHADACVSGARRALSPDQRPPASARRPARGIALQEGDDLLVVLGHDLGGGGR
jgi:hypothetical protein